MSDNTYSSSGVHIQAGYEVIRRIKSLVAPVQSQSVLGGIGAFGGLFQLPGGYREPVLVSGCDGVGTKVLIAKELNKLDTVGIDLVAMSVNDIAAMGAKPLFFLDYLAVGKLVPEEAETLLTGIVAGCQEAECDLLGGETAEMPGVYEPGEFDLAGFAVGIVEKSEIISGENISPGDLVVGLASSGLHSNGFSLVRKVCSLDRSFGEVLLTPTKIYVKAIKHLCKTGVIKGIAHITGGGLPENVGRILPQGCTGIIEKKQWPRPEVFSIIQAAGEISDSEMFNTFNMGVGLVVIVDGTRVKSVLNALTSIQEDAWVIGSITEGEGGVQIV